MSSACVSCRGYLSPSVPYVFKTGDFRRVYPSKQLFECSTCGLVQADVSQIDNGQLSEYYAHIYRSSGIAVAGPAQLPVFKARAKSLADLIQRHSRRDIERVFEVGAGYGFNLLEVATRWPASKLFTDEVDATISINNRIQRATLDGQYDAVIASHVLEHFTSPVELLGKIKRSLAPGAVLVIEVPHETPEWVRGQPFHEPHLTFFSAATLRTLLDKAGLEVEELYTAGPTIQKVTGLVRLRQLLKNLVGEVPGVRKLANAVRKSGAELDFTRANPAGSYLRAVVRAG